MARPSKHDTATRDRAVRVYFERLEEGNVTKVVARREFGDLHDVKESALRNWIRAYEKKLSRPL